MSRPKDFIWNYNSNQQGTEIDISKYAKLCKITKKQKYVI